jgi:hypothetical protein
VFAHLSFDQNLTRDSPYFKSPFFRVPVQRKKGQPQACP